MNTERKLKLLLFGATRNTGFYVMQQALDAGHKVTAIIRNPASFNYKHPNLEVVKGDALQLNTFESEVKDKDAIISSLGVTDRKPTTVYSAGVKNIMEAMQRAGVERMICVSAMALDTNPEMGLFIRIASKVVQRVFKNSYADLRIMEAELKKSSLNWTIVRPPRLMNNPVTGKYRVAVGGHLARPSTIGRADVAHYINRILLDETTYGKIVEVAN